MLSRILLNNETWNMTIAWFGLGKLEVSHYPTGRNAVAPAWLKSYFMSTMQALSNKGIPITPDCEVALLAIETFAEFVLNPTSLGARAALSQNPNELANAIIQQAAQ